MATFNIQINEVVKEIVGHTVTKGSLIYLSGNGKWYLAHATTPGTSTTNLRIALENGIADQQIDTLAFGYYEYDDGTILVPGQNYRLSAEAGRITTQVYLTSNYTVRNVGTAFSESVILFEPDQTYITENGKKINDVDILSAHVHVENDIIDLDKYTQAEVDAKLGATDSPTFEQSRREATEYKAKEYDETIISDANDATLGGFHAITYVGRHKALFAATRASATKILRFGDPNDLTSYIDRDIAIAGYSTGVEQMIYDPESDRLYAVLGDGGYTQTNIKVWAIDPSNLTPVLVIDYDTTELVGSPSMQIIAGDIYITNGYYGGKIHKFTIATGQWVATSATGIVNALTAPHNILTDGEKLYVSSIWDAGSGCDVVRLSTDLTIEQTVNIALPGATLSTGFTDDGVSYGDYLYLFSEGSTDNKMYRFLRDDLTVNQSFDIPIATPTSDLWACEADGRLIHYAGQGTLGAFDVVTLSAYRYESPFSNSINELVRYGQAFLTAGFDTYPVNNTAYIGRMGGQRKLLTGVQFLDDGTISRTFNASTGVHGFLQNVTVPQVPVADTDAASKHYVDNNGGGGGPGTITGTIQDQQVAFGVGPDAIQGDDNFIYTGSLLSYTGQALFKREGFPVQQTLRLSNATTGDATWESTNGASSAFFLNTRFYNNNGNPANGQGGGFVFGAQDSSGTDAFNSADIISRFYTRYHSTKDGWGFGFYGGPASGISPLMNLYGSGEMNVFGDIHGEKFFSTTTGESAIVTVNRTDGKISSLTAGQNDGVFKFDDTGAFEFQSATRAQIEAGTGNTTSFLTMDPTTNRIGIFNNAPIVPFHAIGNSLFDGDIETTGFIEMPATSTDGKGSIKSDGHPFVHAYTGNTSSPANPWYRNTFIGVEAGNYMVGDGASAPGSGDINVGVGAYALNSLTTGAQNVMVGNEAGALMTTASRNIGIGDGVFYYSVENVHDNQGIGKNVFQNLTEGQYNIAIGRNSGFYAGSGTTTFTLGDNHTLIGSDTRPSANGTTRETVIGEGAIGKGSNRVVLGSIETLRISAGADYVAIDDEDLITKGYFDANQSSGSFLNSFIFTTAAYSTASNQDDTDKTIVAQSGTTGITLSGTGLIAGFRIQVFNDTGADLPLSSTDTIKGTLPAVLANGYFAYFTMQSANTWLVSVASEGGSGGGGGDVYLANTQTFTGANTFTAGTTFSGTATGIAPTAPLHFATKQYVDDNSAGLTEAPQDGSTYGRNNATWVNTGDAFLSNSQTFTGNNTFDSSRNNINNLSLTSVTAGAASTVLSWRDSNDSIKLSMAVDEGNNFNYINSNSRDFRLISNSRELYLQTGTNVTKTDRLTVLNDPIVDEGVGSRLYNDNRYEAALGNPNTNGYVLSSDTSGNRTWIPPGAGGGGDVYLANDQTFTGLNIFSAGTTFSSQVTIPLTPTADAHSASKKYVDDQAAMLDAWGGAWERTAQNTATQPADTNEYDTGYFDVSTSSNTQEWVKYYLQFGASIGNDGHVELMIKVDEDEVSMKTIDIVGPGRADITNLRIVRDTAVTGSRRYHLLMTFDGLQSGLIYNQLGTRVGKPNITATAVYDPIAFSGTPTATLAEINNPATSYYYPAVGYLGGGGGGGTVTSIATSGAITGGTITTSGTISHSTSAGFKHIPTGGSSGQILQYSASGTAAWYTPPWTTNVGTITGVTAGTNLTGGGTSGTVTLNMATGGIGSGTYGSTSNATKIDTITVDAYGRVTAIATGAVGDITGVTAGVGLAGGGTSGTVTLNLEAAGIGAGTYGNTSDLTKIDTITVDAYGRITAIATGTTGDLRSTGDVMTAGALRFNDNIELGFGTGTDSEIYSNGSETKWRINNGNIQITNGAGTTVTTFVDTGSITSSGNVTAIGFYESSDRTLKENIIPLDDRYYTFNFKGDETPRYGVIAQELEKTHSELVKEDDTTGKLSVNYIDLLVMEIVELKQRLKDLEDGKK